MIDRRGFLVQSLGAGLAAALPPRTAAKPPDASDAFFAGPVSRFVITLDDANLQALRANEREYVRATIAVDGKTYRDVGIHLKGAAGSRRPFDNKPALTVNFDKFVPGRRFHDIDKLHLNNSVQDGSYLMEIVSGDMFLKAGVPTPRGTHALAELQGRKRGLYVLKEGFDPTFLKRHYKNATGNLYDGGFLTDIDQKIKKSSGSGPGSDHADLQALAVACRLPDLAERAERLEKLLDVEKFLSLVALEVIIWHWDGYGMHKNNYRAYHDPDAKKFTILPHGMDQVFGNTGGSIDPPSGGLIARRMFQMPQYVKRYFDRVAELRQKVLVPDVLDKRVDELVARLKPALEAAQHRDLARAVPEYGKNLKASMRQRAEAIDQQLAARGERK